MTEQERPVANLADITEPGAMEFKVGNGDWPFRGIVVRWQGNVYAYANSCPHLGHPLNIDPERFFTRDKKFLQCSSHGAVFKPDSGECAAGPCAGDFLRRLPARLDENVVYVSSPDTLRD
jgi:nitrite reductase/ring-hydroxylating ferredoxin subunit